MAGCVKPKQRYVIKESSHVTYSQRTDQNNGRHHTTGKAFRCTPFSVTRKKHLQRAAGVGDRRHNCAKLKQKHFKTSQEICPKIYTYKFSIIYSKICMCVLDNIIFFFPAILMRITNCRKNMVSLRQHGVADHFQYSCFLGLLASVTDGSWPCVVS